MKKIALLLGLLLATPAFAADNAVVVTPGVGVTVRSVDVGAGVQAPGHALVNATGTQIGVAGTELFVGGRGTAGAAAGGILTVQGVASMTKLLVTPDSVALPANQSVNVSQINAVTPLMGNGATGTGSQRVTLSNDNTIPTGWPTAANQATEISSLATIATNSALPLPAQSNFTTNIGAVTLNDANSNAVINDPCQTVAKTYTPINVVTATNTIITGVSAKKKYICGIFLYPAGTTNVAIFQATTATACATALVGVIGGTTTATGMVMTAQAGFVLGTGVSSVAATTVNQTDLCIVTSAAVQVSGVVVTVDR